MNDFKENKCRLCTKIFCCQTCREKHEIETHKIILDCDICVYGRAALSTQQLTNHIKKSHWPLHCVYCKRIFWFDEEFFQHKKCPIGNRNNNTEKSIYTPVTGKYSGKHVNDNFGVNSNLASSTPMQRGDANLLEKISEVIITPGDSCENTQGSYTNNNQRGSNQCGSLKSRRVTFCETPITQTCRQTRSMSTNNENQCLDGISETPVSGSSSEAFYSANTDLSKNIEIILNTPEVVVNTPVVEEVATSNSNADENGDDNQKIRDDEKDHVDNQQNAESLHESTTLWISAMNLSTHMPEEESDASNSHVSHFVTPIAVSVRKKINIVMPTPVIREETTNQLSGPIQMSSTPISSTMPTESAPNHSDIFTSNEHYVSSSRSHLEVSEGTNNENLSDSNKNIEIFSQSDGCQDLIKKSSRTARCFIRNRLWKSVSRIIENVSNVVNGLSSMDEGCSSKSVKRFPDYDSLDEPEFKRYKLTDIKCRRTIRELPPIEISRELHINIVSNVTNVNSSRDNNTKKFVDKSTQTD